MILLVYLLVGLLSASTQENVESKSADVVPCSLLNSGPWHRENAQ